jgi:hypothetical protein
MTVFIILTLAGSDTGPFDLYSNTDGFATAFATDITKDQLLLGFSSTTVPDETTVIRVISKGDCINSLDIIIEGDACFKFSPFGTYYFTDFIYVGDGAYLYGNFGEYQNGTLVDIVNAGGIIKLNNDLTVDKSFDTAIGFNQVLFDGSYIREDNLGRIIVTGTFTSYKGASYNRIIRLLPNGDADLTFNIGTGFNNFTQAIVFDSNNSIIVGGIFSSYNGNSAPRIIKLLENGAIDTSFVIGTGFNNTVTDILMNPDDSIFVLGYFSTWKGVGVSPGITKLLANGDIDVSFDGGTGFSPYLPSNPNNFLQIPGETSFYVAGYFTSYNGQPHNRVIKLNADGTVDNSFDAGTGFNNIVALSKIVCNDKLFLTGSFTEYNGIASYYSIILNSDGSVFFPFSFDSYYQPFILGNKIYGSIEGDCIFLIDQFECTTTSTTTTIIP